ncbi:hypothetical protein ELG97_37165 [Rhizobium leguminosarum]|uniref:hypothetical protein n=1 Tax=Rhizobium leguminosarum TaxID=384 RepID=UPI0010327ABC|nr:hypothetical protein [Rhizobium leguminosarum]TBE73862.1 hypothetical protein ELG97_37165 [Rhizobium leguminosarum]
MAEKGKKSLTIQLDARIKDHLDGALVAYRVKFGKAITPAEYITDLLLVQFEERDELNADREEFRAAATLLREAVREVREVYNDKQAINMIAEQIADGMTVAATHEHTQEVNQLLREQTEVLADNARLATALEEANEEIAKLRDQLARGMRISA